MVALVSNLKKQLQKFLTREQILDQAVDLQLYDTDATALFKNQAALIVLPENTEEVSKIIKVINQVNQEAESCSDKINFVARGAGTGLSGGAIGNKNSVIIALSRLNKIIEIDPINQTAIIETGVVNSHLSQVAQDHGLHFAPDPSSQDACTIGGNIAENAGGIHCYKHGVTSEQVLGLEIITSKGEIEYLGKLYQDKQINPKHQVDLSKFFVGSEGTLGIATKALVSLQHIPKAFLTMQLAFASLEQACKTVSALIRAGVNPTAIELIDQGALEAVTAAFDLGLSTEVKAVLLIEFDGHQDEVLIEAKEAKEIIDNLEPIFLKQTQDPNERKFFWKVRKGTVAAFGQIAPFWYLYDAVVPRSKIPEAMLKISEIASKYQLKLASVCHAADGNLHPNFLYDPDKDKTVIKRIHKASKEIMELCIELGGVLSGEHGIGIEKREYMPVMFNDNDLEMMFKLRKIFDPENISNPDKIFPVRICKEM